jgi:hypothetical protein
MNDSLTIQTPWRGALVGVIGLILTAATAMAQEQQPAGGDEAGGASTPAPQQEKDKNAPPSLDELLGI